jgi:hypothetical protein
MRLHMCPECPRNLISGCLQMVVCRKMKGVGQSVDLEEHQKSGLQMLVDLLGTWLEVPHCWEWEHQGHQMWEVVVLEALAGVPSA